MKDRSSPSNPGNLPEGKRKPTSSREDRLKAALKANMARRKAQARARAADTADSGQDGADHNENE